MKNITSMDCVHVATGLFVASNVFGYGIIKRFPKIGAIGCIGTYLAGAAFVGAACVLSFKELKEL